VVHPERFALDFAFVAVFTALTVSMWRGKSDLVPWATAAMLAMIAGMGIVAAGRFFL